MYLLLSEGIHLNRKQMRIVFEMYQLSYRAGSAAVERQGALPPMLAWFARNVHQEDNLSFPHATYPEHKRIDSVLLHTTSH